MIFCLIILVFASSKLLKFEDGYITGIVNESSYFVIGLCEDDGTTIYDSGVVVTISLKSGDILAGTTTCTTINGKCELYFKIQNPGSQTILISASGYPTHEAPPSIITDPNAISHINIEASVSTATVYFSFDLNLSIMTIKSEISSVSCTFGLSESGGSAIIGTIPSTITGMISFSIYFTTSGSKNILATCGSGEGSISLLIKPLKLKIDSFIPPTSISETFSVIIGVYDHHGLIREELHGPYSVTLSLTPTGTISGTAAGTTIQGTITFSDLKILTKNTYILTVSSDSLDSASSSEFKISGELNSMTLSASTTTPSMNFLFTLTIDLFDKDDQTFTSNCGVTITESTSSIIGDLRGTITGGSKVFSLYSSSVGSKTIVAKCPASGLSPEVSSSLIISVLSLTLKFDPSVKFPENALDEFTLTLNVYDNSKTLIETLRGPYIVSLTLNPPGFTQDLLSGTTVDGKIEFTGLKIVSKGTFTITASSNNIESETSSQFTVLPKLNSIVLSTSTATPSMNFIFDLTVRLLDNNGETFTSSCVITLSESTLSIVGTLTDTITTGSKIFSVYSNSIGSKTLAATCPASGSTSEVSGTLSILVLSLALKIDPIAVQPRFTSDEFKITVTVNDNSKTLKESLRGPYSISLSLNPSASTIGLFSGITTNGKIEFTGLRITTPGTYKISASSDNTASAITTESIIIIGSLTSIKLIPVKIIVNVYESLNIEIELYDEVENLYILTTDVIISEANSENFYGPRKVNTLNGKSSISIIFNKNGKKTLGFTVGNVLAELEILVEGLGNPDPKCKNSISSAVCIECVSGAVLSEGFCNCTDNSEYSYDENECLCFEGLKRVNSYCIACGKYYSKSDIVGKFSNDFNTIYLVLSVQPIENLSCEDFLILPKSLESVNFYCTWENILTLSIHFKDFPRVSGLIIGIDPLKLQKTSSSCNYNYEKLDISISYSGDLPTLFASINAPSIISLACSSSDLYINTPNIGRDYEYQWSAKYSPKNQFITDLFSSLKNSWIKVPLDQLIIGTLTLSLKISSSSFKTSATITKTIEIVSDPYLTVELSSGSMISIKKTSNLSIKPIIKEICGNSTYSYSYEWSYKANDLELNFSDILLESFNSNSLIISKNILEAGKSYEFMVKVSNGEIYGSNSVTVVVEESPLVASLSRSSGTIGNDDDFAIYSTVTDPDSKNSVITYAWSCNEQASECLDDKGGTILETADKYNILIPRSKLRDKAIYVFSLVASTETKSQSISVEIEVKAGLVGQIYIQKSYIKLNTDSDLSVISVVAGIEPSKIIWSVIAGNKAALPEGFSFLKLPANTFTAGDTYELELSLIKLELQLTSIFSFSTNTPPKCESLNYEFPSTKKVRFYGVDCVDGDDSDYPLTYQFGVNHNQVMHWVSSAIFTNEFTFKLDESVLKGYLKVCDSLYSCSLISTSISSRQRNLDDISDAFESDTSDLESVPSAILYYSTIATEDTVEKMTVKFIEYIEVSVIDTSELDLITTSAYSLFTSKTSPTTTQVNKVVSVLIDILENIDFELTDLQVKSLYSVVDSQINLISTKNIRKLISIVRYRWTNSKVPYSQVTFESNLYVTHMRGLLSDYKNLVISGSALNLTFPEQFLTNTIKVIDFSFAKYYKANSPVFELQVFFSGYYENYSLVLEAPEIYTGEFIDSLRLDYESTEFSLDSICQSIDYMLWNEVSCKIYLLSESKIQLDLSQSSIFTLAEVEDNSNLRSIYCSVIYILLGAGICILIFGYFCDKSLEKAPHKKTLIYLYPLTSIMNSQPKPYRLLNALHIVSSQSLLLLIIGGYYKYFSDEDDFKITKVAKSSICLGLSQVFSLLNLVIIFMTLRHKKLEYVVFILASLVLASSFICIIILTLKSPESYILNWICGFLLYSPIDLIVIQFIYALIVSKANRGLFNLDSSVSVQNSEEKPYYLDISKTIKLNVEADPQMVFDKNNEKKSNLESSSLREKSKEEENQCLDVSNSLVD